LDDGAVVPSEAVRATMIVFSLGAGDGLSRDGDELALAFGFLADTCNYAITNQRQRADANMAERNYPHGRNGIMRLCGFDRHERNAGLLPAYLDGAQVGTRRRSLRWIKVMKCLWRCQKRQRSALLKGNLDDVALPGARLTALRRSAPSLRVAPSRTGGLSRSHTANVTVQLHESTTDIFGEYQMTRSVSDECCGPPAGRIYGAEFHASFGRRTIVTRTVHPVNFTFGITDMMSMQQKFYRSRLGP